MGECVPVSNEGEVITVQSQLEDDLILTVSIAKTHPLPTLFLLKENENTIVNSVRYTNLSTSDNGTVSYYDPYLNASDSGTYVVMAKLMDYEEILFSVTLKVGKVY